MAEAPSIEEPPMSKSKRRRLNYQRKLQAATAAATPSSSDEPRNQTVETPVIKSPMPGPNTPLTEAQREANYRAVMSQLLGHDPTTGHAASELPGLRISRTGRRNMPYETLQRLARPRTMPRTVHTPMHKPLDKSLRPCSVLVMLGLASFIIIGSFATSIVYIVGFFTY